MKLSEWLRGPVRKDDHFIRWTNAACMAALLAVLVAEIITRLR